VKRRIWVARRFTPGYGQILRLRLRITEKSVSLDGINGESLFYVRIPDVSQAQHDKMSQIKEHNLKKQSQFQNR
jgi:hypothetical protein